MKNVRKNIRVIWVLSKNIVKSTFQNKLGILLFTTGKVVRFVLFFSFAYYLISKSHILKGYSANAAILFYLTYNIVDTISQFLFREVYRFPELASSGRFDNVLTKPIHPFMRVLIGGIDILDLLILVPYIGLTMYFVSTIKDIGPFQILLYFILIVNALLIATAFHILVLSVGLLTTKTDQAMWFYRDITEFGRFPFEIYSPVIRTIFTFVVPVGIMMTFPPKALFGTLTPGFMAYGFVFAVVILFAAVRFWNFSLRRYQSFGG